LFSIEIFNKPSYKKIIYLICLFLLNNKTLVSQTLPITQNSSVPLLLNPASSGLFNGRALMQTNFRNQNQFTTTYPYVTGVFDGQFRIGDKTIGEKDIFSVGGLAFYDNSNNGGFTQTQLGGNIAYHKSLDEEGNLRLGAGFQINYRNCILDYSKLSFASQFNSSLGIYSSTVSGNPEGFGFSTSMYDWGAGIILSYALDNVGYYLGVSGSNLNNPSASKPGISVNLPRAFTYQGGIVLPTFEYDRLYASLSHVTSASSNVTTLGFSYGFNLNGIDQEEDDELQIGSYLRFKDSYSPFVGIKKDNYFIGINYDVNISDQASINRGAGALELTMKILLRDNPNASNLKKLKCKFRFMW